MTRVFHSGPHNRDHEITPCSIHNCQSHLNCLFPLTKKKKKSKKLHGELKYYELFDTFTVKRPIPLNMGKLCDSFHPLTEYEDNDVVPPSGPRLFSCSLLKHTLDPTIMPWEAKDTWGSMQGQYILQLYLSSQATTRGCSQQCERNSLDILLWKT